MQPPHMRSAYPAEMNDERLRQNDMTIYEQSSVTSSKADNQNESLQQLSLATSRLSMHTPPAMNTRKRRSSSWNQSEMETPTMLPRKRRSHELDADMSSDSNDTRSFANSAERKKHRDASQTSYQRPGPPTPSRNAPKENMSTPSVIKNSFFYNVLRHKILMQLLCFRLVLHQQKQSLNQQSPFLNEQAQLRVPKTLDLLQPPLLKKYMRKFVAICSLLAR